VTRFGDRLSGYRREMPEPEGVSEPRSDEGSDVVTTSVQETFHRSVDEGVMRLERPLTALVATGMVGGLDVSIGVIALLMVEARTHDHLLGSLAFGIGFLALTLAGSELFTENFLVPVMTVVAKDAPWWSVLRLWVGTAVFNLVGGWVAMGLAMMAFPPLRNTARVVGGTAMDLGVGRQAFASAILGGALITVMTWMERGTDSVPAKIASAWAIAFLLAGLPLQHAIVISIEAFAALHAGAGFGYAHWLAMFGWAALGNVLGGIVLVTGLRLMQIGRRGVEREQAREKPAVGV
jgi:formate/nitrite transporter FocA (FNT family)